MDNLDEIKNRGLRELEKIDSETALEDWRIQHLGRNSPLMKELGQLPSLPKDQRPVVGRKLNEIKGAFESSWQERKSSLKEAAIQRSLMEDRLDVTLPGRPVTRGRLHPVTQTLRQIYQIFGQMGFQVYLSSDVETDEYNFQLLNMPLHHPAREMQDTFYLFDETGEDNQTLLLRTQTSPGQIHAMRKAAAQDPENPPPIRIIVPGMCYRYEQISTRYEIQFTQVEGLAVGPGITFGDLKGTLSNFARRMFGADVRTRFRASHFPFTEPSAEMDIECFLCSGKGCSVCKGTGWLEILGCGVVHPTVLRNGGYDPERYSGFAFGMGPERITMLKNRIEDIRYFWANDLRFLEQF
jgi:phenylalanyl-tRNA synthetase alpha chain